MDVLDRVREMNAEVGLADGEMATARRRLLEGIAADGVRARKRLRPVFLVAGVVAGAAAATAAVIVVSQLAPVGQRVVADPLATPTPTPTQTLPAPQTEPTPPPLTAASIFSGAGQAVLDSPFPGPGQFLRIAEVEENLANYNSVDGVNDLAVDRMNAEMAWNYQLRSTVYIPANPADVWVRQYLSDTSLGTVFGEGAQAQAEAWIHSLSPVSAEPYRMPRGPGAEWVANWASGDNDGRLASVLESLPADADGIITWLSAYEADPEKMGWILARLLTTNAGSPSLRAAIYEALSALPGAQVLRADAQTATLQYSTDGGNLEVPLLDSWRTITLDRSTGFVTEYTERWGTNPALVPDEVPDIRVTYEVSVVDSAP